MYYVVYAKSKVTSKYQVTVPKEIRKVLGGLAQFSKLSFKYDEKQGKVWIEKEKTIDDFVGILGEPPSGYKFTSVEQEKKDIERAKIEYYRKKYAKTN